MFKLGLIEFTVLAAMLLAIPAAVFGIIYAAVRLAVRHERNRSSSSS
jgi:hypothetical protein